ncbi:MAG TPA: cyclic nucleotide-binding domain-containing protein [Myxococcales bacterium]|nr:cyclic nucleotide-binding domain-containing protein [Myxococcales bacterium]
MATDVRKLKDRAAELMAKRRFDKAAEAYAEVCALEPTDLGLRQRLGDAQRQAGRIADAVGTYQSVADRFAREGLLLKAIAVNKVILEIDPMHTATQATLASLYAQRQGKALATARPPPKAAPPPAAPAAIDLPPDDGELEVEVERAPAPPASGALTPIDDVAEAARAAVAELEASGVTEEPVAQAADEELDVSDELETGPTPELSLDLEAEMERQLAAVPAPPKLPPTPLFSDLDPRAFVDLLQRCTLLRFHGGETIVRQGDPGKSFFVISSGTVRVRRTEGSGEIIELAHLKEGAFFGEMALVSDSPRTASVVADGPLEVLEFPAEVLHELMAKHASAREAVEKFTRSRLLASVMATSPLFRPFDAENRRLLIERFLGREVAAGEKVLEQGKPGDGLYVIVQGRFQILRQGEGAPALLSELHEGDVFGEISLLTHEPASADVVAVGPARVLRLPRQVFDEVILTHPQILELVAKLSEERSRTTEAVLGGKVACDTEGLMLL